MKEQDTVRLLFVFNVEMPTDFMNRHVMMKDLVISRFSRYEEMCFVNKQCVRNCFYVCLLVTILRTFFE